MHNDFLCSQINKLSKSKVRTTLELGINPDYVEAICFGWLAKQRIENKSFDLKTFINNLSPNLSTKVTSIVMNNDLYHLHNWQSKNVFVKDKKKKISQLVTESILTLRTLLINKKVSEFLNSGRGRWCK